jgi:hypothetical protein
MSDTAWPELSLVEWEPTYLTLHRWTQIAGKIRLALAPFMNHWWHTPLYVTSEGLTTSSMPVGERHLTLTFDFCSHRLLAHTSDNRRDGFPLEPMSVADFYQRVLELLARLDVAIEIWPVPQEIADRTPFTEDRKHAAYDRAQVERMHRILLSASRVFSIHRGRFLGKASPVHFFWGGFDLAVTRFSGRANPSPPPDKVMREAYSHEVISHGLWFGGDWPMGGRVDEAVFYAYAVPEPTGFRDAVVPPGAAYASAFGEYFLPYRLVREASDPDALLLDFMEATYLAGATGAGWEIAALGAQGK